MVIKTHNFGQYVKASRRDDEVIDLLDGGQRIGYASRIAVKAGV